MGGGVGGVGAGDWDREGWGGWSPRVGSGALKLGGLELGDWGRGHWSWGVRVGRLESGGVGGLGSRGWSWGVESGNWGWRSRLGGWSRGVGSGFGIEGVGGCSWFKIT